MIRDRFSENIKKDMSTEEWLICQDTYDPQENLKNESLFALSNGYLGIRGSFEEGTRVTLPYLYVNGVFDKSETFMRELAALPNWLGVRLYVEKELIGIENCEILEFSRVLDMKHAVLYKQYVLKDKKGRVTKVEGRRFVSRHNVHRMAIELFVTPVNYDGIIEAENIIDGTIVNFYDAPRFKVKHVSYRQRNARRTRRLYRICYERPSSPCGDRMRAGSLQRRQTRDEKPHVPCLWGAGSGIWRCSSDRRGDSASGKIRLHVHGEGMSGICAPYDDQRGGRPLYGGRSGNRTSFP